MLELEIDFTPVTDAIESLIETARGGYAFGPVRDAGIASVNLYSGEERRRFMDASHGGGDWPDLASSTKRKRWHAAGNRGRAGRIVSSLPFPILYITGELYSSLVPGGPLNILDFQTNLIIYGTQVFHAAFHQFGTITEPQREILVSPGDELLDRMADLTADALASGLNSTF